MSQVSNKRSMQSLLLIAGMISILASGCFRHPLNLDPSIRQPILNQANTKPFIHSKGHATSKEHSAMRVAYHDDHPTETTFADHQSTLTDFQIKNNGRHGIANSVSAEPYPIQTNQNAIDFEIFEENQRASTADIQLPPPADRSLFQTLISDQREFYSGKSVRPMLIALGTSAVLSSTEMDHNFSEWYQSNIRSAASDDISKYAKHLGEHWQMVGVYFGSSLIGRIQGRESILATWGDRSVRSTLVGFPPLLALQKAIGSTRPNDNPPSSRWNFNGDDNGASGHTFIGAIPFLVAAQMTDERLPKATLIALSTVGGWSRINDDHHYLSQVVVGWCLAYIATESIYRTELKLGFEIEPVFAPDRQGFNFIWRR